MKPDAIGKKRIWEIDFLRGACLLYMVFYHTLYDLSDIFATNVRYDAPAIYIIGRIAAVTFIALCGVSCSLSRNNLKRGVRILFFGILISIVTFLFNPELHIWFGILHLLGTSVLLYVPIQKSKPIYAIVAGLAILAAGLVINHIHLDSNYFLSLVCRAEISARPITIRLFHGPAYSSLEPQQENTFILPGKA